MVRRPIQDYFFFGTAIRYLQDASTAHRIGDYKTGWGIKSNLGEVLAFTTRLTLKVTQQTDAFGNLRKLLTEFESAKKDDNLSAEQVTRLRELVDDLRATLEAELRATFAYSLTPKRLDVSKLIEDPEALFTPGVYNKLPSLAQYDLKEAGKCIAFELPTSAAFHLMRAIEATLRVFYAKVVRSRRNARMWGEIVADIRKRRVGAKHSTLLNHLDHIRNAFRNPTQHPEATYDIHEVQDLWNVSADVFTRMAPSL